MITIRDTLEEQDRKEAEEYFNLVKRLMKSQRMSYWIGNPSVQIIFGELFLSQYKQPQKIINTQSYLKQLKQLNRLNSQCLTIVGLPNGIRPLEVWESLGDTQQYIQQFRVIKTQQPGFYSLLIFLTSVQHCKQFYKCNFGKKINELQSYLIIFRELQNITIQFDEFSISQKTQLQVFKRKSTFEINPVDPQNIFITHTINQSPSTSFVCAICFQEMKSSNTGILSILCSHYFHESCLSKWNENTCPLCRYHQQPPTLSFCESCNNNENLWLCLVCGKKLCAGDSQNLLSQNSHIHAHYKQTEHSIAMQIQSKFIYEFSLKQFLHRVYFNQKTNGPDSGIQPKYKKSKDIVEQCQKVAMLQMQQQRKYFQKQITDDKRNQKQIIQSLLEQINALKQQNSTLVTQLNYQQQQKQINQLQSELKTAQKYHNLLVVKIKSLENKTNKIQQIQTKQLEQIQIKIVQKRQQIKDIQQNITANKKIKKKLEGQKIAKQFYMKK